MRLWLPAEGAIRACDDVLWLLGIPESLTKADGGSPLSRRGFDAIVRALVAQMLEASTPVLRRVQSRYQGFLDRRWGALSREDRERVIERVVADLRPALQATVDATLEPLTRSVAGTITAARQATALKHGLDLPRVFSPRDDAIAGHARSSNAVYMRDGLGRIVEGPLANVMRQTIARGIDDGLDDATISKDLGKALAGTAAERTEAYFTMVASTATARARSYGMLASFQQAGIERYQVQAVLDENTCSSCRFMHGRTFDVGPAAERFAAAAAAPPAELPDIQPFLSTRRMAGGALYIGARTRNTFEPIAEVERSAVGRVDDLGAYREIMGAARIQGLGAGCCPFHPHCRCTTVPVFSTPARRRPQATGPTGSPVRITPAPASPSLAPTAVAPPGRFEIRTIGARPLIGPSPTFMAPDADPGQVWRVREAGRIDATTETIERVFGRGRIPTLETLSKAWADGDHTFDFQNIFSSQADGAERVHFWGYIRNSSGKVVSDGLVKRTFAREASGKLVAHHDFMVLKPKATPDGFATRVVRNACATYTHLGVDAVEVHAAWSGKFAWPTMGFDWLDPIAQRAKFTEELLARLPGLGYRDLSREDAEDLAEHPWKITDLDTKKVFREEDDDGRELKMRIGQKFMYDQKKLVFMRLNLAEAESPSFVRARRKLFGQ